MLTPQVGWEQPDVERAELKDVDPDKDLAVLGVDEVDSNEDVKVGRVAEGAAAACGGGAPNHGRRGCSRPD